MIPTIYSMTIQFQVTTEEHQAMKSLMDQWLNLHASKTPEFDSLVKEVLEIIELDKREPDAEDWWSSSKELKESIFCGFVQDVDGCAINTECQVWMDSNGSRQILPDCDVREKDIICISGLEDHFEAQITEMVHTKILLTTSYGSKP